jgi:hypothetical protein
MKAAIRIATAGPRVGVGLVLTLRTIQEVVDCGGQDLVTALAKTNPIAMDKGQVELLQRLREQRR